MAEYNEESSNESQSEYSESEDDQPHAVGGSRDGVTDRLDLPSDLKGQSFEEILAIKDQVGLRTFKTAIGLEEVSTKRRKRKKVFKRENKHRPREMSSKIPVTGVRNIFNVKKKIRADPRFEEGFEEVRPRNSIKAEYKAKQKARDYAFIDALRDEERENLKKSLAEGKLDEEESRKAQLLLQKFRSRDVTRRQKSIRADLNDKYTKFLKGAKDTGESVKFMNKTDWKRAELIAKFNELKKAGNLDKYLEKKRKKNATRDRKKMEMQDV